MLEEKIFTDYQNALKEKDNFKVSVLRFLRSAIKNMEIDKRRKLEDNEIIAIIRKQIKNCQEAIEEYRRGNRQDLVEKEAKELAVLNDYLPASLSEQEILEIIYEVIRAESAAGLKNMGKVMKGVLDKVAGRADTKIISELVKKELSK